MTKPKSFIPNCESINTKAEKIKFNLEFFKVLVLSNRLEMAEEKLDKALELTNELIAEGH